MERITDAFVWPFRDPDWLPKVAIIGLILIIPIAGQLNGLGWMLTALDNLRKGEQKLPPGNFSYLGRGLRLFIVNLVYGLVLIFICLALLIPTIAIGGAEGRSGSVNGAAIALAVVLDLLTFSLATLGSLALSFALPAIVLETDRAGIAGGLNVVRVFAAIRATAINTLIAGLMLIAAGFVGGLGLAACFVGVLFTSAYSLAMQAWIVRSYELGRAAPAPSA